MAGGTSDTSVRGEIPQEGGSLAGHREAEGAGAGEPSPGQQLPGCSWFSVVLHKTFSLSVPPFFNFMLSYFCLKCYLGQSSVFHRTKCRV